MFNFSEFLHRLTPFRKPSKTNPSTKLCLEPLEDRSVPTLLGQQLFPADNPWNQKITNAPVASNSASIMNSIINTFGNNRLHPDFGQDYNNGNALYGIPYNVVHGNSVAKVNVVIDNYPDESDIIPAPIPATVVIEGDNQNGPNPNRGDSHLIIYDIDNNIAYEFYDASRPSENADGKWHAAQQSVWDFKTNQFRTIGWTSVDAAGLSVLAGLARPDEGLPVSQGGQGVINHAIRMTLQNSVILNQFIYPASHVANPGNSNTTIQPPMGARFRLKSSVDISTLNPQSRIIAQAMKDYGLIVADNGSNFYFSGASTAVNASNQEILTWNDNDIQSTTNGLKRLRFADFEVVDLRPIVSSLSVNNGNEGTSVTITGQNFSGAAGRLSVLFGNTPATNVTIVSDTQITVAAPTGSGTVNVRVQSGLNTGSNSQNINSPIFGYGLSAVNTSAQFTYGAPLITTSVSVVSSGTPTVYGQAYSFTATVTPASGTIPTTSTITFTYVTSAGTITQTKTIDSQGKATFSPQAFSGTLTPVGNHSLTVTFNADGTFGSSSASLSGGQTINKANTKITITGLTNTSTPTGANIQITATVSAVAPGGGTPTGSAQLVVDGVVVQTATISNGTITVTRALSPGTHSITLNYLGNDTQGRYNASNITTSVTATPTGGGSPPLVPPIIALGADAGGGPQVRVYNQNRVELYNFYAYAANFSGGVRVATGDVNGDGIADILTAAGGGGGPHVKVFDGRTRAVIQSFYAYAPNFSGGVYLSTGDINGDGFADILTTAGPGGGPHVKAFDGRNGNVIVSFYAYASNFSGGVLAATGDTTGDGRDEIITTPFSGTTNIRVFDGRSTAMLASFMAYGPSFQGGAWVAAGDTNGDHRADIIVVPGPGMAPNVKVFNGVNQAPLLDFLAYSSNITAGLRVSSIDRNNDGRADIITVIRPGFPSDTRFFSGVNGSMIDQFFPFDPAFTGGVFVG